MPNYAPTRYFPEETQVLIIGGGLFGMTAAIVLGEAGYDVVIVERRDDVLLESSLVNQNRVHRGYHYPRSLNTGRDSMRGLVAFEDYYGEAIVSSFDKYYAIARENSKTDVPGFIKFCQDLGLELEEKWPDAHLLNRAEVDACWLTRESVFDYHTLRHTAVQRLYALRNRVRLYRNVHPTQIEPGQPARVTLSSGHTLKAQYVLNATYAGLPDVVRLMGGDAHSVKYQYCLMPILRSPTPLEHVGITVMDGPFCSLMPKGLNTNEFILYHVTYSVLESVVAESQPRWQPIEGFIEYEIMDYSLKFFPVLKDLKWKESWITTRVVLPEQEQDDARPTLLLKHGDNLASVFSGKITTCVDAATDVLADVRRQLAATPLNA